MISLRRYTANDKSQWDFFVKEAKNSTFLFLRNFMEYHQDRFTDHSLLFFNQKQKLIALLPANEFVNDNKQRTLASHQGLTYGGFILSATSTAKEVLDLMETLRHYLQKEGFERLIYKPTPTIYHRLPAQEDLYALFRNQAKLIACNLSCCVELKGLLPVCIERRRKRGFAKAKNQSYKIMECELSNFWPIMEENLKLRYKASPVHSLSEMQSLKQNFVQNIRCLGAFDKNTHLQAGVILFINPPTIHVQYGHATQQGKNDGALDFLYFNLMDMVEQEENLRYLDFGTSNEQNGYILNETLIAQKEGFGARGIVYPTYEIKI